MVGVVLYTDPGDDGPKEAQGSKPYPGLSSIVVRFDFEVLNSSRWARSTSFVYSERISCLYR
jgi:hypothetical protein